MAVLNDIFTHSGPSNFADEAPGHSISIGERIAQGGLDIADSIIRAKYGDKASIPRSGGGDQRLVTGAGNDFSTAAGNSGMFLLIVALLVVFLLLRR